jgi:hypothetical protein
MRRLLLPLAILAALGVSLALAWAVLHDERDDDASGTTAQSIDVGSFRRLEVEGRADVVLVQGDAEAVEVDAGPHSAGRLRVRARGGTVSLSATDAGSWWGGWFGGRGRTPRIVVRFRSLESVALAGAVQVAADAMRVDDLRIRASGATSLRLDGIEARSLRFAGSGAVKGRLAGRVDSQEVSISGAGDYRARDLVSARADVKVSGAGRVVVHAERELDATISGAGSIEYAGDPEVRQSVHGAGRIRRLSGGGLVPQRGFPVADAGPPAPLMQRPFA